MAVGFGPVGFPPVGFPQDAGARRLLALLAFGGDMLGDVVTKGATDRSVTLRIFDATTGLPATGLAFNSAGIDLWYRRESAAKTSITEATLSALTDAHADGGFLEIGNGAYRLDLPDAAFATGANHVDIGGTLTGYIVSLQRVRLVNFDWETAISSIVTSIWAAGTRTLTSLSGVAADIRSAVGLASANLDTQLDALPTNAELSTALAAADDAVLAAIAALNNLSAAAVNAEVDTAISDAALATASALSTAQTAITTIKAKTDSLTFTQAGHVDANVQRINDVTILGDGSGTPFGVA